MRYLTLLLCAAAVACGDNGDSTAPADGAAEDGAGSPGRVLADREYQGDGVTGQTWIDGHVVGEGAPGTLEAQLEQSFDDFGARIDGSKLVIRLPSADGAGFTISRDTAESAIPGAVALDLEPGAATVQTSAAGGLRDVDKGTVTISDCPKSSGDLVRGSLQSVVLAPAEGDARWRMDLDFQVVVTNANGELRCSSVGGDGGDDDDDGDTPAQCPNTLCEDPSFGCCPFDECLNDCEAITCNRIPCEGDEASCRHNCLQGCVDQCGISGSCLTTIQGLWDCQLDSGCFSDDSEMSEDACTRSSCCDAFTATF